MRPRGIKAFDGAKDQPRTYSYEQRQEARVDKALERQFRANGKAWNFFQEQAAWYRRPCAFWVINADAEETRKSVFQR